MQGNNVGFGLSGGGRGFKASSGFDDDKKPGFGGEKGFGGGASRGFGGEGESKGFGGGNRGFGGDNEVISFIQKIS